MTCSLCCCGLNLPVSRTNIICEEIVSVESDVRYLDINSNQSDEWE